MHRYLTPTLSTFAACMVSIALLPGADEGWNIEQRLQALAQEVKLLNEAAGKNTAASGASSASAGDAPRLTANAKDGFWLVSADGAYRLRLGGYAQFDGKYFLKDDVLPFSNTFTLSKVRPIIEGTLAKYFDFRIMFELTATPALVDAYLTANIDPAFKITAGRFKVPFGLEMLQGDTNTAFVARGLPSGLSPTRDAGFQVSGDVLNGALNYAVGIFNGAVDGGNKDTDTNDDKDGIARVWATPFKDSGIDGLNTLNLGFAASHGYEKGTGAVATNNLPTYKTPGNNTFFTYDATAFAKGDRTRYSPQLYWPIASFDVMAEYIITTQRIQEAAVSEDVSNRAWQIEAGYILTGEKATMKGVVPTNNMGPGGWGALQVVARVGAITIDNAVYDNGFAARTAQASSATAFGVGVNWFLNRNVKLQLNYDHTTFKDGATAALGNDRESEKVIQTRVQFAF